MIVEKVGSFGWLRTAPEERRTMKIHETDNVEIRADGMKYALCDIARGEKVMKYGFPIGEATEDIKAGDKVHSHNLKSRLSGLGGWEYRPEKHEAGAPIEGTFMGYRRRDGRVGIRNELWIIPTVGCANDVARELAAKTGAKALTHPYGCSQLGGDLATTGKTLAGLVRHPNAGGVLVLGLGCEENHMALFREVLGEVDEERVKFLNLQDCGDETAEALALLDELKAKMAEDVREAIPLSELKIGIKCGGSDGYSGITANPLVGKVSDRVGRAGGTVLMTEVPEVFGAEEILLSRCVDRATFDKVSDMIKRFREYFISHGEGIADNPSPGNVAGGITTLEEKSLGCVQKGDKVPMTGALEIGEAAPAGGGLYLVYGPGNDQVAVTNLAAAGAHLILFTTGRGTPLCAPVPTLKISTNSALAEKKPGWIDFNAGVLLDGADMESLADELFDLCVKCAEGKQTRGESRGFYDIAIFKDGVTL